MWVLALPAGSPAVLPAAWEQAASASEAPSREAELEALRGRISDLQARLGALRARSRSLAGELETIEVEVELQERRVDEVRVERALAETRVGGAVERIAELEVRLAASRVALRGRLAHLYRLGRAGPLRLLFSIRSDRDLLAGIRMLRFLARQQAEEIGRYLLDQQRLGAERDRLERERRGVEALLVREDERLAELNRGHRRRQELLAAVERERRAVAEEAEELADKERKLANFLDFLYGRNPVPLSGTPVQELRGVLDWPVRGRVAVPFGPRLDPRYRTRVPHNGIGIETRPGTEVRVVFPGTVLYAAPFQGYGLTVIVNHPGRVFTLYAGLDRLGTGERRVLSLGEVVGLASDRLYFEIRVQNTPEDPLNWLR
jgi:septal ring factor EnvC (AmiA/AmiB activator)